MEALMMKGAKTLVDTCANVSPGEKVLIVTDFTKLRIADVPAAALMERRIEPVINVMTPRELDGQEPPDLTPKAMSEADVIFLSVSISMSSWKHRPSSSMEKR